MWDSSVGDKQLFWPFSFVKDEGICWQTWAYNGSTLILENQIHILDDICMNIFNHYWRKLYWDQNSSFHNKWAKKAVPYKFKNPAFVVFWSENYLESALANRMKFLILADEPRTHTIWPYSCIMDNICSVVSDVQSVNSDTSNGTLSTCSKWGLIFIIPHGNFA